MSNDLSRSQKTPGKPLNWWRVAAIVILVLAVASRFYALGDRAVSHDETTHAKYSWNFYAGQGFRHDPLMHGTLLFEATALFYALFGVSDFTARLYTALAGIALVMAPWLFQKWLGRLGSLLASVMVLISPAIAYYSRYTRHDIPLLLFTTLLLWTVLRYLDEGKPKWLYGMAAFFPLMFASKENAYIYMLIFLLLMALPFIWQIFRVPWKNSDLKAVLLGVLAVTLLFGSVSALGLRNAQVTVYQEDGSDRADEVQVSLPWWGRFAVALTFMAVLSALAVLYYGIGEEAMRSWRLFDVLMTLGTLTLPLGSALFINFVLGADMKAVSDALNSANLKALPLWTTIGMGIVLATTIGLSVAMGLVWNRKIWPNIALIHYGVFFLTFSSIFTYGWGMVTGLLGGLAYWMAQQGVQRGTQPWYYYGIVGPLYEFLPLLLCLPAGIWAIVYAFKRTPLATQRTNKKPSSNLIEYGVALPWDGNTPSQFLNEEAPSQERDDDASTPPSTHSFRYDHLFPVFLLIWSLLSWVAYTFAGEKMPWLFVHIAFPHILLAAWALGQWLQDLTWNDLVAQRGWVLVVALFLLWRAMGAFRDTSGSLRSMIFPEGNEGVKLTVEQLQPLGSAMGAIGGALLFGVMSFWTVDRLGFRRSWKLALTTVVFVLAGLTVRTMVRLNYINDELPVEYMVYAHATPDVKVALRQIEDASWRLTGAAHDLKVAFDWDIAWPFLWYMQTQYPNRYEFHEEPDAAQLLESPAILVGKDKWDAVDTAVGDAYIHFDYKDIWWPLEDYKNLTQERIRTAITDPNWRAALLDIVMDRDYTRYAQLRDPENPFTLKTWPHRVEFRLYLRRDLSQQIWSYGAGVAPVVSEPASPEATSTDPFAFLERRIPLLRRAELTGAGLRDIAISADGSLYVTDATQHGVWHLSSEGDVLNRWGGYGTGPEQFNEPWGIAVDSNGDVYVADTWNHRVQKFDAQGQPILRWGRFAEIAAYDLTGQGAFFAPCDVAVGKNDLIYVSDTGNKRVQVFDSTGNFLGEFGGAGSDLGKMNEPIGLAVTATGNVWVADTRNRRLEEFDTWGIFARQWPVSVWDGLDPAERPFVAADAGILYVSDPLHGRVLAFTPEGEALWALKDEAVLHSPSGLAVRDKMLYIVDAGASQILGYQLVED
ncbi:MAG: TIGR03663 family protein [Anaerolineae bacterium]|nr:TIGR03663 family protein [Anaerolineae bacterium]